MERLSGYRCLFWDFDGVIKDSNHIKDRGYYDLFLPHGNSAAEQARDHNRENGGISRLLKIPLYLREFAGVEPSADLVAAYLSRYSELTVSGVVDSPWVEPVIAYIRQHQRGQIHHIVTGSVQEDIDIICDRLGIRKFFAGIHGSPPGKGEILGQVMRAAGFSSTDCAMVGDAKADQIAAAEANIEFYYVESAENKVLFTGISDRALKFFSPPKA